MVKIKKITVMIEIRTRLSTMFFSLIMYEFFLRPT
jgi:hypothetical protein